jgi:hypothetical protein
MRIVWKWAIGEVLGNVRVAADDAAAVAQHADDAAVLPVADPLAVGPLEHAEQVLRRLVPGGRALDLRHEARPGPLLELVEKRCLNLVRHAAVLLIDGRKGRPW